LKRLNPFGIPLHQPGRERLLEHLNGRILVGLAIVSTEKVAER
jgi:hypothetical protein